MFFRTATPKSILLFFFLTFIYFWDRERQHKRGRGRERGRHRIGSRLQALSHQPRAQCGAQTHGPWDRDLSWSRRLNRLSHPGAPGYSNSCMCYYFSIKHSPSVWRANATFSTYNIAINSCRYSSFNTYPATSEPSDFRHWYDREKFSLKSL